MSLCPVVVQEQYPLASHQSPGATNYSRTLSVSALPAGVTASFSPNPFTSDTQGTLTLTADTNAQLTMNAPVTVTASRSVDDAQRTAQFFLTSAPPPGQLPNNRMSFVRTEDSPSAIVYDATHNLVFASAPKLGRVDVIFSGNSTDHQKHIRSASFRAGYHPRRHSRTRRHVRPNGPLDRHFFIECRAGNSA